MTRFKKFKEFVVLALWAVLMVALSLVVVYGIILINVSGFTNASRGALTATIVFDIALPLAVVICISDSLTEIRRKQHVLLYGPEPPTLMGPLR